MGQYRTALDTPNTFPGAEEAALVPADLIEWDFFFRAESNNHHPADVPANSTRLLLPGNTPLAAAIAIALDRGLIPQGTARSGCFEVQTDAGVFSHEKGRRIDLSTPRKAQNVTFQTWETIEDEVWKA